MYGVGTSWVHSSFLSVGDISSTVSTWVTVLFVLATATVFTGIMSMIQEVWARRPRFIETAEKHYTLTWNVLPEQNRYSVFGTVLAWVVFELLNTLVQSEIAFPWLQAGYAFIDTWLVGLATVGGVTLVSFFVLVTAMALYRIQRIQPTTMVLATLPWVIGLGLLLVPWTQQLEEKEVALVQSNLSITEKTDESGPTRSWSENTRLSLGTEEVDFVIWPEGALHTLLDQDMVYALYSLATRLDASVITGILSQSNYRGSDFVNHNVAVGVSKHAPEYEEYQKLKMVPFGEKIPFEPVLKPIVEWLKLPINTLGPGMGPQNNMVLDGVNVGVTICYEIAFPSYVATRSRDAAFLVNISEDGWFGNSIGPAQHMQIARMRALETGRYVARATTKGISGIIDHKGKVVATIPANEPGVVRGTIQIREGETWFVRYLSGLSGWIWGVVVLLGSGTFTAVVGSFGVLLMKRTFFRDRADPDNELETNEDEELDEAAEEDGKTENDWR